MIVVAIEQSAKAIKDAEERTQKEIFLLCEYRIRLIADVVTGKLDVREAAAKLPDEIDEPEMLDDADAPIQDDNNEEGAVLDAVPEEAGA